MLSCPSMNALALAALLGLGLDWSQTSTIAQQHTRWHELNPLVGRYPTQGHVNTVFAVEAVAAIGVTLSLPPKVRPWFLRGLVAMEVVNVLRNRAIGIQFSTPF